MRAVTEAMKGLLEDTEDRGQSPELKAMEMSIDTLIRTTKEAMADKEKKAAAHAQPEQRS
jgi:hypothetical protein